MNERIQELVKLAGAIPIHGTPKDRALVGYENIEKFAELIVRECVRHSNEDYERNFDTLWREDLSKSIKQHFGVEE